MKTMNEVQLGNRIRYFLNQGTHLDASLAERLRASRERALAAYRPRVEFSPAFAGPGYWAFSEFAGLSLRVVLAVALVAGSAITLYSWEKGQRQTEIEEIDAELLADEVPLDALLDQGFDAWLKKRNAR